MSFKECILFIKSDFDRYCFENDKNSYIKVFFGNPPLLLLIVYRLRRYFRYEFKLPIIKHIINFNLAVLYNILRLATSIEIDPHVKVGKGLFIPHIGSIVIHYNCEFGDNCTILQCVTTGNSGLKHKTLAPKFGSNVVISAGAKVIGEVVIGDNVIIGANAVVTKDVPSGAVVVGIPARVIKYNEICAKDRLSSLN